MLTFKSAADLQRSRKMRDYFTGSDQTGLPAPASGSARTAGTLHTGLTMLTTKEIVDLQGLLHPTIEGEAVERHSFNNEASYQLDTLSSAATSFAKTPAARYASPRLQGVTMPLRASDSLPQARSKGFRRHIRRAKAKAR